MRPAVVTHAFGATCLVDLQTQGTILTSNESTKYHSVIFHPGRCYVERFVWVWREESALMLCYARSVHVPSSSDVIKRIKWLRPDG